MYILNNWSESLNQLLKWNQPNKIPYQAAINWAKFWLNTTADQKVKARLQTEGLPLKLYELLKENDPEDMKVRVIKPFNEEYLILIVELILRITAGNKQIEQQLTNTVISDLATLKSKRDMFFINKVLLPLIKNEETIPVCLVDQNLSQEWSPNIDSLSQSSDSKG